MSLVEKILQEVEVGPDHPFFYPRVATYLIRHEIQKMGNGPKSESEIAFRICCEEFEDLSRRLERTNIQEGTSVRNILKTRLIATKLIGEDGELEHQLLPHFISAMEKNISSIAPKREADFVRDQHILDILKLLYENKEIVRMIRGLSRPVSNRLAEQIIRDTLSLPPSQVITDVHVRRACLSALFCLLRQSLGSCFATAPAILIQQEQPIYFLKDMDEMMSTGCLRRTFGGKEQTVPMSSTWGNGDLRRPIILERDLNHNENKVWMAPGLISALDAAGIFDEKMNVKEKSHELNKLLLTSLPLIEKPGHFFVTNAEELLRVVLLDHNGLKESDIENYLSRPKAMAQSSLIMHAPTNGRKNGRQEPILAFLSEFEVAKIAFKRLADNALLKSWEFTLASFSQSSEDFSRWNLYASIGINYDDPGGVGQALYKFLVRYVDEANNGAREREEEYNDLVVQMQYLEGRAKMASTEKEIAWVKMEYQSRQTELYHIQQLHNMARAKAQKMANLSSFLIDEFDAKFPEYFQEVYDAEIHDIAQGPFDDSPAGFRLLYKHGRTNPSLWTKIYSLQEFIDALASFFTIMEIEIRDKPEIEGIETEFTYIITALVGHIRSDEFMESSFYRMAKAHGVALVDKPLENLDKVDKKPWVYTSGGSMATLMSAYFRREEKPTEVSRWVENETELLAFFIDSMKQLPVEVSALYEKNSNKSLLIHSPTHAFLLKPGLFYDAWKTDLYTYTWIKQVYLEPTRAILEKQYINEEMGKSCIAELLFHVPQDFRPRFKEVFAKLPYRSSVSDFRDYIVNTLYVDRGLRTRQGPAISSDVVDSVLYSELPYLSKQKVEQVVIDIVGEIFPEKDAKEIIRLCLQRQRVFGYSSAKKVLELIKACACIVQEKTKASFDLYGTIVEAMRERDLILPKPLIFADSNWVKDYFAFVVSPTSHEIELWSVDYYGVTGRPISYWKQWLNGSRRDPKWGIYSRPLEYVR